KRNPGQPLRRQRRVPGRRPGRGRSSSSAPVAGVPDLSDAVHGRASRLACDLRAARSNSEVPTLRCRFALRPENAGSHDRAPAETDRLTGISAREPGTGRTLDTAAGQPGAETGHGLYGHPRGKPPLRVVVVSTAECRLY